MIVTWNEPGGTARLWHAFAETRDFRQATWRSEPLEGEGRAVARLTEPEEGWAAFYVEVQFPALGGAPYGLSTEIVVVPDTFPHDSE